MCERRRKFEKRWGINVLRYNVKHKPEVFYFSMQVCLTLQPVSLPFFFSELQDFIHTKHFLTQLRPLCCNQFYWLLCVSKEEVGGETGKPRVDNQGERESEREQSNLVETSQELRSNNSIPLFLSSPPFPPSPLTTHSCYLFSYPTPSCFLLIVFLLSLRSEEESAVRLG